MLAARPFDDGAEQKRARGAVGKRSAVRAVGRLRFPWREALDRQAEGEADPVLGDVHAFLVSRGIFVVVVALEQRAHGQQVFDRDRLFARIGIGRGRMVLEPGEHMRLDVGDQAAVDRRADQHRGHGLGQRSRVVELLARAAVEIIFVEQSTAMDHEQAGGALPGAIGNVLLGLLEQSGFPAKCSCVGHRPAVVERGRLRGTRRCHGAGAEQNEHQQDDSGHGVLLARNGADSSPNRRMKCRIRR